MIRLGLCCIFREAPIKFRATTATAVKRFSPDEGRKKLADVCAANAEVLLAALRFCSANGIGCFCVNSQNLPRKTHPDVGYELAELPGGRQIVNQFRNRHHDYIDIRDFPVFWQGLEVTVEVEVKAKELAVKKLAKGMATRPKKATAKKRLTPLR